MGSEEFLQMVKASGIIIDDVLNEDLLKGKIKPYKKYWKLDRR